MSTNFDGATGKEVNENMKTNESIGNIANRALFETFKAMGRGELPKSITGAEAEKGWQELEQDVNAVVKRLEKSLDGPV